MHHSLNIAPALEGHALENGQEGVADVVEVCDAEVRITNCLSAEVSTRALHVSTKVVIWVRFARLNRYAPELEESTKKVGTSDGKDHKEEQQHDESILKQG